MRTLKTWRPLDFEQFGSDIARETRDKERSIELGGLKIHEYRAMLQPDIDRLSGNIAIKTDQKAALCEQLYDSTDPVSDKAMLARAILIKVLVCGLAGVMLMSLAAHIYRLILFGVELFTAVGLGIVLTTGVAIIGHLAFEKLRAVSSLEPAVIGLSACLLIWGMFQLAQAGSIALGKVGASPQAGASYVDDGGAAPPRDPDPAPQFYEGRVKGLLSGAVTKILLSADLALGILLGIVLRMKSDERYVIWRKVEELEKELEDMTWRLNALLGMIEVAQRQCMAGILRFFYGQRKQPPRYFKAGTACLALLVFAATTADAQTVTRQEGILLDASGSIGVGGASNELFREYLAGVRRLLVTEPPSSRVVVSLISTESFGSGSEVLKGWTPAAQGVFTDDLERARSQLASAFEKKAAGVTPIAAGTDIIGGLWRIKTLLESSSPNDKAGSREIWIFSDMMNETAALPMPALLASGPDKMIERVKANGLLVPLKGYRIHVLGASTRGLTPKAWQTIRAFWGLYCQAAGAELVSYSAEATPER